MAGTRTRDHDGHEHTTKTIYEEILGIKIDDRETSIISEAFGWKTEKFEKMFDTIRAFSNFQNAAEELDEDLPESTRVSVFADFLKSGSFKKLGIKITTPNDYIVLGYIFGAWIAHERIDEMKDKSGGIGGLLNGGEFLKLLKELSKRG